jgi:hypothetical protein
MRQRFSALLRLLLGDLPWAVCPAESFAHRFAELEQRLRAAYPSEQGYRICVSRTREAWTLYARNGLFSGFAVTCVPDYGADSFTPSQISVWVGTYSPLIHLAVYLLGTLLTSALLLKLVQFLDQMLLPDPVVSAFLPLLFVLAIGGLGLLLSTYLWAAERRRRSAAQLDEVRQLVR